MNRILSSFVLYITPIGVSLHQNPKPIIPLKFKERLRITNIENIIRITKVMAEKEQKIWDLES